MLAMDAPEGLVPVKGEGMRRVPGAPDLFAKGGCAMQAPADQVRWVPIDDIVDTGDTSARGGDAVLLAARPDGRYTLLRGRERLRHMREAGQACVDAVLSPTECLDERISRLLDGLVRGTIHYLDEAETYHSLLGGGLTTQELAVRLGRTPATLRRKLRLNNLGEEVAGALRDHGLCERYAHALLRVPGIQGRLRVLKHVTDGGLSVKETEKLIDDVLSHTPVPMAGGARLKPLMRDYRLYINAIRGIVEQMADAGLEATMQVNIGRKMAEVRISVPVFSKK